MKKPLPLRPKTSKLYDKELAEFSAWLKKNGYTAHVSLSGKVKIKIKGTDIVVMEF